MSKEHIKSLFREVGRTDVWSLQLVRINNSKRNGTSYFTREISLSPQGRLKELILQLSTHYLSEEGIDKFDTVDEYTGDVVGNVIYRLPTTSDLIHEAWETLKSAIANPDTEEDILGMRFSGYIISGTISLAIGDVQVKMVSMGSPTTVLRNKYIFNHPTRNFNEITDPVFTFKPTLDAIIIDEVVYFFTMQAENLFNMERAHKKVCEIKVGQTISALEMTNPDSFKRIASSGANPRRFVSFNEARLNVLKDRRTRKKYASMFKIKTTDDGNLDTDDEKSAERLVKFLCNKAAIDPVENEPKEVSAMKGWA